MKLSEARVLFVDDEPSLLSIFALWLSGGQPHHITTAADGQEALEKLATNDYDLLITDVNMPRVDGIELVRRMAEMGKTPPGIVFVSGFGDVNERDMYGLGVEAFLSKPVARNTLLATAERALAERSELFSKPLELAPHHSISIEAEDFSSSTAGNCIALGRGGFSAPYANPVAPGKIRFNCHVARRNLRFSGEGYVRWRSKAEGTIGVEIAYLDDSCRDIITEEITRNHSSAFIPSN